MRASSRLLTFALNAAAGCTSFSTVRPATVTPGPSVLVQAAIAQPPGDEASWFYSGDCADNCNRAVPSADVALAFGRKPHATKRIPMALGVGLNGLMPYVEGYFQLSQSRATPFGIGARIGSTGSWFEHQLYMRFEKAGGANSRLLWNPGILLHHGNSPNGENPGTLLALVNGFGVELGSGRFAFTPSASMVVSKAQHTSAGRQHGPETRVFGTAAMSMTLRRNGN